MDGFDPKTSFGYEESRRYDATDTRGDEPETVAFLARLAGLRLRDRWGGWTGERFTSASWRHISVYHRSLERSGGCGIVE